VYLDGRKRSVRWLLPCVCDVITCAFVYVFCGIILDEHVLHACLRLCTATRKNRTEGGKNRKTTLARIACSVAVQSHRARNVAVHSHRIEHDSSSAGQGKTHVLVLMHECSLERACVGVNLSIFVRRGDELFDKATRDEVREHIIVHRMIKNDNCSDIDAEIEHVLARLAELKEGVTPCRCRWVEGVV